MAKPQSLKVDAAIETWLLKEPFVIARGAKSEARVVVATITDGIVTGRGECVPYARYGETVTGIAGVIRAWQPSLDRDQLQRDLPAGAARNALDCALWDFHANQTRQSVPTRLKIEPSDSVTTAFTLSLADPDAMAAAAHQARHMPVLKLKLGGGKKDAQRMRAVRQAVPKARLIADANESWQPSDLAELLATAADLDFEMIEQPLPEGHDAALAEIRRPLPVCADESHHTEADLASLVGRYDAVNIKLDKTGGLTAALAARDTGKQLGLKIMIGSMVGTSLAVAPAFLLSADAAWVDLDGPLLLAHDRGNGFQFDAGVMTPPAHGLWGAPANP